MRRFYLASGVVIGLLVLLAASFALFSWRADAEPRYYSAPAGATATPTPLACEYMVAQATGTIVPSTDNTGNFCDDCSTEVILPFPITFYGQEYYIAYVSSNGNLQFVTANPISFNECFPAPSFNGAIFPHWTDLMTDDQPGCPGGFCGIFTSVMGTAPHRVFTVEWRAVRYRDPFQPVNFQIWFYEGQTNFDFVYGAVPDSGETTIGVQNDDTHYTQYSCMTPSVEQGMALNWTGQNCPAPTATATATPCPGCTPAPTATITRTPTMIPTATGTPCGLERFTGSLTSTDPTQMGRLIREELRSICAFPKVCPPVEDQALRHYDSYTRTNDTGVTRCVTVGVSTMCNDLQFIFAAAYLGSFNPDAVCQNYLADMGFSPYPHSYMSFLLPAGSSVVVVVSEVVTNQGCPLYTVTIAGLGSCAGPEPTPTGTPPTATITPTATATPCGYDFATATATIAPGTEDTGNHCDDCVTGVTLPFPFQLYNQVYTTANVSSNGNIQFASDSNSRFNVCLPALPLSAALLPHWTDLVTDCFDCGIFTSVSGSAPDRIFNVEWRAGVFKGGPVNFEARLYEGTNEFDFVYGAMSDPGNNTSVGVQNTGAVAFTQYSCNAGGLVEGLLVKGIPEKCALSTSTPTLEATATSTSTSTSVAETPSPMPTSCTIQFEDVPPGSTWYPYVQCLFCRQILTGYPCGGAGEPCVPPDNRPYFRPNNAVTRGQISKIVSQSAGFNDPAPPTFTFTDVPVGHTFHVYVEALLINRPGVISGYPCGGPGEPCDDQSRPYFRPNNTLTRGQLSKIVCRTYQCDTPVSGQTFEDVPVGSTFYTETEQLYTLGAINGYLCGGVGEPCVPPDNRPYFRPGANVTRGQITKIVVIAFFPECNPADRPRRR